MAIAYLLRSSRPILCFGFAAVACSGATESSPDGQPDVNFAPDAGPGIPPIGPGLDAKGEAPRGAGPPSVLTVSPTSIDLGVIALAAPSPQQLITVIANADISDLDVLLRGADLTLDTTTCAQTLAAGTSCVVAVTFLATTTGTKNQSIAIVAGGEATVVPVTADARTPAKLALSPATAMLMPSSGQSSHPVTIKVGNIGGIAIGPLTVQIIEENAADFTATPVGCEVLAPGSTCTITVVFAPGIGAFPCESATLVVTGPGPDSSTAMAALTGSPCTGSLPLSLTSATPDLGQVAVGTTGGPVRFTLANSGSAPQGPVTVAITDSNPEFVITDDTCTARVLPAGGACSIGVALRPTSVGSKQALLTATTPTASVSTGLIGTGVDSSTDASIADPLDGGAVDASTVSPLDSAGLDANGEAQGEAGRSG